MLLRCGPTTDVENFLYRNTDQHIINAEHAKCGNKTDSSKLWEGSMVIWLYHKKRCIKSGEAGDRSKDRREKKL